LDRWWRFESKVRKEACDLLNAMQLRPGSSRKRPQFDLGQETVSVLYSVKFLGDHKALLETGRYKFEE
jgi:hypothetical protein